MYHSFLIHSSTDGHLGCFQILAIVDSSAMNIRVHKLFWIGVLVFLGYIVSSRITGSKGSSTSSVLWEFHTVFHSGCTSLHSHQHYHRVCSLFSTISPELFPCWYVYDGHSDSCEVVAHCGFNFHLSDANVAEHPSICLWALCMSFGEVSVQVFCPVFNWVLSSWSAVTWVLYIFWRSNLVWDIIGKYIFPYSWFCFHFADGSFSHVETSNLM